MSSSTSRAATGSGERHRKVQGGRDISCRSGDFFRLQMPIVIMERYCGLANPSMRTMLALRAFGVSLEVVAWSPETHEESLC